MNDIFTIAANLATQDGRMTHLPMFVVQQKERQFPGDPDADDPYYWVDDDWNEVDEEKAKELDAADEWNHDTGNHPTGIILDDYTKVYYRDVYRFVQPFFTEAGAKRYIEINGHNLREPRIYVESGYRNEEWETVRELLFAIGAVQDKRTLAQVIEEAKVKETGETSR
jgi:hypothetical protein